MTIVSIQNGKTLKKISKERISYLFLLPAFSIYILFFIYPLFRAFIYSFCEYKGRGFVYVGVKNYLYFLQDDVFRRIILNTCTMCVILVPTVIISSILIANYIVRKKQIVRGTLMGIFYFPGVTSIVTICIVWKWIYNSEGILNYFLSLLDIQGINWLGNPSSALLSVVVVLIYICIGMPIILITASIGNIPDCFYEVASLEGATNLQKLIYITLPLIKPTILYLAIILTITSFRAFIFVILLTAGGPYYSSSVIASYLANTAFECGQFGKASTIGILLLIIISILTLIQYKFFKGSVEY